MRNCDLYKLLKAGLIPYRVYYIDKEKLIVQIDTFIDDKWESYSCYDICDGEYCLLHRTLLRFEIFNYIKVDNVPEYAIAYE